MDYQLWHHQHSPMPFDLSDIPLLAWLLASLSPLLVIVINEIVKLHEIRYEKKSHWKKLNSWLKTSNVHFACKNAERLIFAVCSILIGNQINMWFFSKLESHVVCDLALVLDPCLISVYSLQGASPLPKETETAVWNETGDELSILIGSSWRCWRVFSGNRSADVLTNEESH